MRYIRLLILYAQDVIEYRSLAVVWFFASLINPLLFLLFWKGAIVDNHPSGFSSVGDVYSYYFLYLILSGFLMVHIEHEVAYWDIKEGGLTKYILKPIPYITSKFFLEVTWRIAMGLIALVATIMLIFIFGQLFTISLTPVQIILVIITSLLALMVSFVYKMIIGLTALWVIDFEGIEQLVFMLTLLFSGFVVPLDMFPQYLRTIATFLPIPYTIYYPVRMFQGKLTLEQSLLVIGIQILWLFILSIGYKAIWNRGVKRFTGVGL